MLDFLLGNDFLSTVIAFALVLIPAVIVHELGHFLAAKAVGITVLEFAIGFPPRLARLFRWGETEFTLNWIPLGGFVRPLGEDMIRPLGEDAVEQARRQLAASLREQSPRHPIGQGVNQPAQPTDPYQQELAELKARGIRKFMTVNEAKPLPRIFFMAAGALSNFISAFVLFIVIGLIGIPQDAGGTVEILQIQPGSEFETLGLQSRDLIEELNGEKFADSQDFFAKLNALRGQTVSLRVRRPETGEVFSVQFTPSPNGEPPTTEGYVRVLGVAENSPAHLSGLRADDLIKAFNGQSIGAAQDPTTELQRLTEAHAGEKITLTVLRGIQELTISLTPRLNPPAGEGRIGISIWAEFRSQANGLTYTNGPQQQVIVPQSLGESVQYSLEQTSSVLAMIAEVPARLVRGTITPEEARPVSIIGISQWGSRVLQQSIQESQPVAFLHYIAIINILLGLTNLLPLPALDGGRIVFVLLEIVRGRPISPEREGMIHLIGLVFILSVGVFFMLNDLINPLPILR